MTDKSKKEDVKAEQEPLDLSVLAGLDFGPHWGTRSPVKRTDSGPARGGDRKPLRRPGGSSSGAPRVDRRQGLNQALSRPHQAVLYRPSYQVDFYPADEPFVALTKAMRASCKTYELFEIAKLILDKPERFVVVVAPKEKASTKKFFAAGELSIPFESEEDALAYVIKKELSRFFELEEVAVEAPKGNFTQVNRCGYTGELLGPPNYHRYQDFLKEHHQNKLSHMPFEKFTANIEPVKDDEQIQAWVAKMSHATHYKVKKAAEGEDAPVFNTWEEARSYLMKTHKEELVHACDNIRFLGVLLKDMPEGEIKRSVEVSLARQREFPLDTANNLRGRLRRMKFAIYKKGAQGVSYVCAVKRNIRQAGQLMAENLQSLISFIEKNPNISVNGLALKYLGLVPVEPSSGEEKPAEAIPLNEEQKTRMKQVMLDLRWLVSEGYVTEYGNGSLFAPAPTPLPSSQVPQVAQELEEEESDPKAEQKEKTPEASVE